MALPVTIGSSADGFSNASTVKRYKGGPHLVGGNVYFINFVSNTGVQEIQAFKATDPTSLFTEQDSSNRPSSGSTNIYGLSSVVSGTSILVAFTATSSRDCIYAEFDTSTDAWVDASNFGGTGGNTEYTVYSPSQTVGGEVDIAVRSDGDVIIAHTYGDTADMGQDVTGVSYHRLESGTWTTNVDVAQTDSKGARNNSGAVVMGSSDQCHFAYVDEAGDDFNIRALSSGNALRTERTFATTIGWTADRNLIQGGVNYTRSATETIGFHCYINVSAGPFRINFDHFTDDSSPTFSSGRFTGASAVEVADNEDYGMTSLLVEDTGNDEMFGVYVDDSETGIFARTDSGGATWSDENSGSRISTNALSTDGRGVSANIYTRGGNVVLAFVYDDGDQNYYDEYVLRSSGTTGTGSQTLALFSQAGTGVMQPDGSGAQSLAEASQAGSGSQTESAAGSGAQSLSSLAQTSAGLLSMLGSSAQSLQPLTQTATVSLDIPGAAASTLQEVTQSATGVMTFVATGAQVLVQVAQSGVGVMNPSGTAAQSLQGTSQSAVGVHTENAAGAGAQSLAQTAQSGSASESVPSLADQLLPSLTQSAAAAHTDTIAATGAQTLQAPSQSASAIMLPSGVGGQALALLAQAASGVETFTATGAQTMQTMGQTATASESVPSLAAQALAVLIQAAASSEAMTATTAQAVAALAQNAIASESMSSSGGQALALLTQAASATTLTGVATGAGAQTLAQVQQSSASIVLMDGAAAQVLQALGQSGLPGFFLTQIVGAPSSASIIGDGYEMTVSGAGFNVAISGG